MAKHLIYEKLVVKFEAPTFSFPTGCLETCQGNISVDIKRYIEERLRNIKMYLYGYKFPYSSLCELSILATVEVNSFHSFQTCPNLLKCKMSVSHFKNQSTSILDSKYTNYFNMKAFFLPLYQGKKKNLY